MLLVVLGTAAFGGLGLLVAGTLRAEVTLAAANLVWLVLLFAGGIAIPLSKYPDGVAATCCSTCRRRRCPTGCTRCFQHAAAPGARHCSPCWSGPRSRCRRPRGGSGGSERDRGRGRGTRCRVALRGAARWPSVVANVVIVVTGGAVRLTGSGLGCPTWPSCTDGSLTPHAETRYHGLIENTNRQLTFVLSVIAIATLAGGAGASGASAAWPCWRSPVIPAQAVLGGITVLTHLNPWVVAVALPAVDGDHRGHLLLWWRLRRLAGAATPPATRAAVLLARLTVAVTAAVLVVGTVVTGSGPHAGDDGRHRHRIGLAPAVDQPAARRPGHGAGRADGRAGAAAARRARRAPRSARGRRLLLGVELAQGVIGYTQYFLHVPAAAGRRAHARRLPGVARRAATS